LASFYEQWKDDVLVVGKWFAIQAMSNQPGTLDRVKALLDHPAFDLKMPNLVRSLIGAFSQSNPVQFHQKDGSGYRFLADHVIALNAMNPQIASRMLTPLTGWSRFDLDRQHLMKAELQRVMNANDISPDVYEVASKALA
jgi:aminopeptidase N